MATRTVAVQIKAEIGQYVAGMSKASAATMRLGEAAKGSQAQASKSFDIAGKGALIMGGAVVAGLGLAVSKSMDFEASMSAAAAATQTTASTLGDLRAAAMKAGADTQYSATEAADAITEMGKAGVGAKDIMGGGLSGALDLAAAGQMNVADAAGIAATAMVQFGLAGQDLPHVADLLAAGAGKAMGSVEDLSYALKYVGPVAAGMGVSIEETTGTLALFASQGILGEQAGTSLRGVLSALTSPSKAAAKEMEALGINVFDARGNFIGLSGVAGELHSSMDGMTEAQRSAALGVIFGNEQVTAARILYKDGASAVKEWTDKVNDSGYAQEQAAALTDNLKGDIERLGGAFDTFLISAGTGAQGPLRELVQALTGIVDAGSDLIGFWTSLPGPVQVAIVTLGAVAALKNPVSSALETIALKALYAGESMAGASFSMGGLKAAGAGLLGVFGGPWGLAITGATVGLSMLVSWLGKSDTAAADNTESQDALAEAIRGTGGAIDYTVKKAAAKELQDSGLLTFASAWGVASDTMVEASLNQGDALDTVRGKVEKYIDGLARQRDAITGDSTGAEANRAAIQGVIDAQKGRLTELENLAGATSEAVSGEQEIAAATGATGEAMGATTAQTEEAAKALQEWIDELAKIGSAFVDPLETYKSLLSAKNDAEKEAAQATADATDDASDSWEDYVGDVSLSLDELATSLEEQLAAQDNWRANILLITQRGGIEVGQALADMGAEGAGLAAQMADATDAEFQRMAGLIVEDTRRGGEDAAAELDQAMKIMAEIGAEGGEATAKAVAEKLGVGLADVQSIASQYGVELASGLDPLLQALGSRTIALQRRGEGMAGGGRYYAGGYTGDGGKYEPKGVVHGGEFVFTKEQTSRAGVGQLEAYANSLAGYATGGFVSASDVPKPRSTSPYGPPISTAGNQTMQAGYDAATAWMNANAAGPGAFAGMAAGGVQRWAPLVLQALGMVGQPASLVQTVLRRMNQESGGNPAAINNWDINAVRGTPSKGLMQVIDPTFRANAYPGYSSNVYDPLSNILASMQYAIRRYGSLSAAYNKAGGYANGGTTPAGEPFWVGERGPELMWSSREQYVTSAAKSREFSGSWSSGGGGSVSKTDARSYPLTIQAGPGVDQIVRATRDAQRDMEFLHG